VILRNSDDSRAQTVRGMGGPQLTGILEKKYRIHTRARVIAGEFECSRMTPNLYTTLDEIDRFTRAVQEIATRLEQPKVHLNRDRCGHGTPVRQSRTKAPTRDGVDGFFVKPKA